MERLEKEGIDFLPITKPLAIDLESDEEYGTEMQRRGGKDPDEEAGSGNESAGRWVATYVCTSYGVSPCITR